jgi:transposase
VEDLTFDAKEGMMKPISMDLRERIFEAREAGESTAEVAERFAVSPAFVRRLLQRYRQSGSLTPSSGRRGRKPLLENHYERIRDYQSQHQDLTPAEIRDRLQLQVSPLTVWRALRRLGLSFKKSQSMRPSNSAPTSNKPGNSGRPRSRRQHRAA